jgi:hypothetical protein
VSGLIPFLFYLPQSARQRRLARSRPSLDKNAFIADIVSSGGDAASAAFLWDHLEDWAHEKEFTPYPDDDLQQVFGIAEEELEIDIITTLFQNLRLPLPTTTMLMNFGRVDTPRQIAQLISHVRSL